MDIKLECILKAFGRCRGGCEFSYIAAPDSLPLVFLLTHTSLFHQQVWQFSSAFSSVDRWSFSNIPSMSDHLKSCSYYQREERTEPVALACLSEVKDIFLKQ